MRVSLMLRRLSLTATVAGACLAASAGRAAAEGCDEGATEGGGSGKNFHIEIINGQPVTVIDSVVQVCGKVPRPSVVYVLQPKTINYEWENLKQDFLPLVIASLRRAPF